MQAMLLHPDDGEHQRQGIDRTLVLSNGQSVWVDEKVRGKNRITGRVYTDIALEYVSNTRTKAAGWVRKPLLCHYIAYAIAPLGIAYLLPTQALQAAWRDNCNDWFLSPRCQKISAKNRNYCTLSLCVPPDMVMKAVGRVLQPTFTPCDHAEG